MDPADQLDPLTRHFDDDACVFLVHGTWAPDAEWITKKSQLAKALGRFRIRPIRWSGKNLFSHREKTAVLLAELIDEVPKDKRVFVVGHSHAGNIAVSSIAKLRNRDCNGVVTLNTPFLSRITRDLRRTILGCYWIFVFGSFAAFGKYSALLGDWGLLLSIGAVLAMTFGVALKWYPSLESRTSNSEDYDERPAPKGTQEKTEFLCLNTAGDEVFGAMQGVESVFSFTHFLIQPMITMIFVSVSMLVYVSLSLLNVIGITVIEATTDALILCLVVVGLLLVLSLVGGLLVERYVQGIRTWMGFVKTRTLVILVPLKVVRIEFREHHIEVPHKLRHSVLYDNPLVVEEIAEWIKART